MKHDLTCWTIAIGLHLLLLLVNFNMYQVDEAKKLIPVVEVEYITQEEIISTRIARMPGRLPQTFKEKLKHFFSKEIVPVKKEVVLAGKAPSKKLEVEKVKGLSAEKRLVDKGGSLTRKVDLSPGGSSKEKLISREEEERILLASREIGEKDLKSGRLKDKDKDYRVSRKDLPFQVSSGEELRGKGVDTVAINLGKETSKGILTEVPGLKDIKRKGELGKGVFRVVKKEEGEKLSGTEVLANLLAIAKEEEARKEEGYGSGMGSGEALEGKEVGSGGGVLKEVKGKEEGKEKAVRKGVVFAPAPVVKKEEAETGVEEEGEARREQRGRVIFEIRGPLSQRKILRKIIPTYPEWAEKEGVEAGVSVHFIVLSDGKVKDNIYVVKTSGYPGIDKLVMETLREWLFASLKGDIYGKEEWGVLTFYFTLNSELARKG